MTIFLYNSHGQVKCVELLLSKGSKVVSDYAGVSTLELCAQVSTSQLSTAFTYVPLYTHHLSLP